MRTEMIAQGGRERVVMDRDDYQDLIDARDHPVAMRDVAGGAPVLVGAGLDAYLAAATPLAFWRQRTGRTQADLEHFPFASLSLNALALCFGEHLYSTGDLVRSNDALAAEVGVSQRLLAQIEGGEREGGVGVLVRIARARGVKVDDLVGGC